MSDTKQAEVFEFFQPGGYARVHAGASVPANHVNNVYEIKAVHQNGRVSLLVPYQDIPLWLDAKDLEPVEIEPLVGPLE